MVGSFASSVAGVGPPQFGSDPAPRALTNQARRHYTREYAHAENHELFLSNAESRYFRISEVGLLKAR